MACFWYNCTTINCLLTIFVHNYYAQPIYYTDVIICRESLADYSTPLIARIAGEKTSAVDQRWWDVF